MLAQLTVRSQLHREKNPDIVVINTNIGFVEGFSYQCRF